MCMSTKQRLSKHNRLINTYLILKQNCKELFSEGGWPTVMTPSKKNRQQAQRCRPSDTTSLEPCFGAPVTNVLLVATVKVARY